MSSYAAAPPLIRSNPMQRLGFAFLVVFLFFAFSRVLDLTLPFLHLPLFFSLAALAAAILSGGVERALRYSSGRYLLAFTVWMIVCIPFSSWRGGSFQLFTEGWSKSILCYLMVAGLTVTLAETRRLMLILAASSLLAGCLALSVNARVEGRLFLAYGLLSNPNDLAQQVLLGLPFCALLLIPRAGAFRAVCFVGVTALLLRVLAETGSRAALIALCVMTLMLFYRASPPLKVLMMVSAVLSLLVFSFVLSASVRQRYFTTFGQSEEDTAGLTPDEALESRRSRWVLFLQSLKLTAQNPIFGVGPGVFSHASTLDFRAQGRRSLWKETHNSFTQVSSETGLPGLFLFSAAIVSAFRGVRQLLRRSASNPRWRHLNSLAFCLLVSLTGFLITCLFSSIAYKFFFPTLIALSAAFEQVAENEMTQNPSSAV